MVESEKYYNNFDFMFDKMDKYIKKNPIKILDLDEFMKHPIYDQYCGSKSGHVYDFRNCVVVESYNLKPLKLSDYFFQHHHKKECIEYRNKELYIDIDYYGRITIQYPLHVFIWVCFNGLVPRGSMVEHINGFQLCNHLSNLKLVKYKLINFDCDCSKTKI